MTRYNQYRSWWLAQPEPKARIGTFYRRLRDWKTPQEAIVYKAPNRNFKPFRPIRSNPWWLNVEPVDISRYLIEVTYKPEEAEVFHRLYRSLLEELEDRIYAMEDLSTSSEYNSDLNRLIEEYNVFKSYNPIEWTQCDSE